MYCTHTWCNAASVQAALARAARLEWGDLQGEPCSCPPCPCPCPAAKRRIFLSLSRNSILDRIDLYSTPLHGAEGGGVVGRGDASECAYTMSWWAAE